MHEDNELFYLLPRELIMGEGRELTDAEYRVLVYIYAHLNEDDEVGRGQAVLTLKQITRATGMEEEMRVQGLIYSLEQAHFLDEEGTTGAPLGAPVTYLHGSRLPRLLPESKVQ